VGSHPSYRYAYLLKTKLGTKVGSMQCCQSRGAKGYASLGPKKLGVLLHKFEKLVKGGSVEERLYKKLHSTANLNFLVLSLFVYLLKNCSSQFFSNWESAEPVFCNEELSCLPYKKTKQKPNSQFWGRKIQICCFVRSFYKTVLPLGHL
jgi:hypothetical protein